MRCNPIGSVTSSIDLSEQCLCKPLVTGALCDQCKVNSFHLNEISPKGCIECFCFGVTDSCTSSFNLYRDYVELKMDQYQHGIVVRDRLNTTYFNQELTFDHFNRELIFSDFVFATSLYWQLPYQFMGNKISSYGGYLNYTFGFKGNYFPRDSKIPDAVIVGHNITLVHYHQEKLQPLVVNTMTIPLYEHAWSFEDETLVVTRADLMFVLSNIDTILIRASLTSDISSIQLSAITLDTTVERLGSGYEDDRYARVSTVENCHCPVGYTGTSCEQCSPGYTRSKQPTTDRFVYSSITDRFKCEPCFCNGHSNDCDPETGYCIVISHSPIFHI